MIRAVVLSVSVFLNGKTRGSIGIMTIRDRAPAHRAHEEWEDESRLTLNRLRVVDMIDESENMSSVGISVHLSFSFWLGRAKWLG